MSKGACSTKETRETHGSSTSGDTASNEVPPLLYIIAGCYGVYTDVVGSSIDAVKGVLLAPKSKRKGPRGGVSEPFPSKLYDMLVGLESEGLTYIASWTNHGRCFAIARQDLFIKDIMPRYFKQSKLTSFQRQMNLYGFQRVSSGVDKGCFYHPLFLRGRPDICKIMLRTRTKGNYGTVIRDCGREIRCESLYDLPHCPPTTSEDAVSALDLDASEILDREVSSLETDPASPAASSPNEFSLVPYSTPAVPLLDERSSKHDKAFLPQHRTPCHFDSSSTIANQESLSSTAFDETNDSAESHHDYDRYYQVTTADSVVLPTCGPQLPWALDVLSDEVTSTSNYMDPLWACTFQFVDNEEGELDGALER